MKVSIKIIAERLGVSPALVSLVLNGKEKEARISKITAEKIKALAAELNYSPNRFAKGLKKGKSNILGLIVADISNPFFARLARYIEDEAERCNYKIIIGSSDESAEKMTSLIHIMKTYHVDGFIIAPAEHSQDQINDLLSDHFPLVLVDRYFKEIAVDNVLIDNEGTARKAAEYLIGQGCKRLAAFTYQSELLHFLDRIEGFKNALSHSGIPFGNEFINYVRFRNIFDDVKLGITKILHDKTQYDGIFFVTDTLALNGIKILRQLGVDVPERLKLLSFDENSTFEFLNFPVPHFVQPLDKIGKEAVKLIVSKIENSGISKPKKIVIPATWVEK
jgi:LacI family transcriptional regulator